MRIKVKGLSNSQPIDVIVLDHDCYDIADYSIEKYDYYHPSPQQVDEGTDHDEIGYVAICNLCGRDMPHIDLYSEELDEYDERQQIKNG